MTRYEDRQIPRFDAKGRLVWDHLDINNIDIDRLSDPDYRKGLERQGWSIGETE